jgi:hypothetical protein
MKRTWIAVSILVLVVCGGLACISALVVFGTGALTLGQRAIAPQPTATEAAIAAPQSGETQVPQGGETQAPPAEATSVGAPTQSSGESLSLASRDAGLDKLKSYRIRWQSQWTTTEGGKTQSASWDWSEEYSSSPEALHWTWKFADVSAANQSGMEAWQVGDTTYMVSSAQTGQANCISFSTADASQRLGKGLFSPKLLGSLSGARYVGNDTVNGIPSKHFQYDEKAVTLGALGKVTGEAWTAVDGGYVVKDLMKWEGSAGLFGSSATSQGVGQWDWELSDANQPITIKAPDNCQGAAGDLPMMPDAKEKSTFGDTITYKSASKVADVVAFYKKAMLAAGWKAEGEATITDNFATLTFSQNGKKAQVSVTSEGGQTNVIINVAKQ